MTSVNNERFFFLSWVVLYQKLQIHFLIVVQLLHFNRLNQPHQYTSPHVALVSSLTTHSILPFSPLLFSLSLSRANSGRNQLGQDRHWLHVKIYIPSVKVNKRKLVIHSHPPHTHTPYSQPTSPHMHSILKSWIIQVCEIIHFAHLYSLQVLQYEKNMILVLPL